jgi:HlyD family secretion protein
MHHTHDQKLLPPVQSEDFLPPISPWTFLAGVFLVGSVVSTIALSSWVKYNVTVKAAATVRPTGDVRLVQPQIEGTIKSILVKENQIVKQGEVIASLDDKQLTIKKSQLQDKIQQAKLQVVQIDAQVSALSAQVLAESRVKERTLASAQADLRRNQREHLERQTTTKTELLAAEATLQKAQTDLQKAKSDLNFADRESRRYQKLTAVGVVSLGAFEQKQQIFEQAKSAVKAENKNVEIAKAKRQAAIAAINPSMAMVNIAQERIAQETAKGESTFAILNKEKQALIQQRVEIVSQIKQSVKEIQQVEDQMQKSIILATSDGIILKLNLRNPGQFVHPNEPIAQIIPQNANLIIKAMVSTQDIKKVAVGEKVQLRVDACPYPDYGTLKGVVSEISPDTITSQSNNLGATNYFETTIKPESLSFGNGQYQCHIQSGMEGKAEIISQEETALKFILRKARLISDL